MDRKAGEKNCSNSHAQNQTNANIVTSSVICYNQLHCLLLLISQHFLHVTVVDDFIPIGVEENEVEFLFICNINYSGTLFRRYILWGDSTVSCWFRLFPKLAEYQSRPPLAPTNLAQRPNADHDLPVLEVPRLHNDEPLSIVLL